MKKQVKKLKLSKETLRGLSAFDLAGVGGKGIGDTVWYQCWGTYGCPNPT